MRRTRALQRSSSCTMRQSTGWSHCGPLTWLSIKVNKAASPVCSKAGQEFFKSLSLLKRQVFCHCPFSLTAL